MKSIFWLIAIILLLAIAPSVEATPILLGTLSIQSSGFGIIGNPEPLIGISSGLVYLSDWHFGAPCLGCEIVWVAGQSGQVDFVAGNTPDFSYFANRLTDGLNDIIGVINIPIFPTPIPPTAAGSGQFENLALGGNPDFIGHHVDLIRWNMLDVEFTITPAAGGGLSNLVETHYEWKFYEDVQVPELSSFALLIISGSLLAAVRCFRYRTPPG